MNAKGDGKCSPEHKQTMTQRECPLVAKLGTPTTDCDITLPLKSSFQTLHKKSRKFRREVKRRWIRGRMVGQVHVMEEGLEIVAEQSARMGPAEL